MIATGGRARTPGRDASIDVLVVVIDSTAGWSAAAEALVAALRRVGASAELARTGPVPRVRTFVLTDLTEAWLARRATLRGIAAHHPRVIVYASISSALLWPRPGAIFLDSIAAENRPGRHGLWQRPVERRRLQAAPLLMSWNGRSLAPLQALGIAGESVVTPPPVDPIPAPRQLGERDVDVVVYAGDPQKRRLAFLLEAWEGVRRPGETLVVCGLEAFDAPQGVHNAGRIPGPAFRELLARTRVFAAAPRREDHGIAALEALAAGAQLLTTEAPGPYVALELARALDPRLVLPAGATTAAYGAALRAALDAPRSGYAEQAATVLAPFSSASLDRTLGDVVLPRLLTGWRAPRGPLYA